MVVRHVPILKAKKGEFKALEHTHDKVARKLLPLFEVGRLTEGILKRKYLATSSTPTITYLNRVAEGIMNAWGDRPFMLDGYYWAPEACTEDGVHVITHMSQLLKAAGATILPVVGYDRWENETYRVGMKGLPFDADRTCCLRLDTQAIEDAAEPEFFLERIASILDELDLSPARCSVLIDFGDVTTVALDDLTSDTMNIVEQLLELSFGRFITAGCSIPKSIELAVKSHDAADMVIRREMLLWKTIRQEFKDATVLFGDYGVRGPNTNDEIRSRYINGKIRHTTGQQTFVTRGHPFSDDGNAGQMHALAKNVVESPYYLGANFSWGDERIKDCSLNKFVGSTTDWIAIDTNHHFAYAVQEVEEFELGTVMIKAGSNA